MGLHTIHSQKPHNPTTGTAANRQALLKRASHNQGRSIFGGGSAPVYNNNCLGGGHSNDDNGLAKGIFAAGLGALAGISIYGAFQSIKADKEAAKALSNNESGKTSETGAVDSKSTIATLKDASNSTDLEQVAKAIETGRAQSGSLDSQINASNGKAAAAGDAANQAKSEADAAKGNADAMGVTLKEHQSKLGELQAQVSGEKSSASLTTKMNLEISNVQKTTIQTQADGTMTQVPNPNYDKDVKAIQDKYQPQIDEAKNKEAQISELKDKTIPSDQEQLRTYQQLQKDKTKEQQNKLQEQKDAKAEAENYTKQKAEVDALVAKLEVRRTAILNNNKPVSTDSSK